MRWIGALAYDPPMAPQAASPTSDALESDTGVRPDPFIRRFVQACAAVLIVGLLFGALSLKLNPDEWQMTIAGWAMSEGMQIYTEVWDNHGPLLDYALYA
jgi:hypothetical protein